MSLIDRWSRSKDAPVEPAADERTPDSPCCVACGQSTWPLEPLEVEGYGFHPACKDETSCRQRNQLAGRYCVYPAVA